MSNKFRTNTADAPEPRKPKAPKPNPRIIPIFDADGNRRGHCGLGMSSAGVSRFTGTLSNRLGKKDGRTAWIARSPSGPNKAARAQSAKLAKSLKADKGSNR
jgi:hypothetical protein